MTTTPIVVPALLSDADLNKLISEVCKSARNTQSELQRAIVQSLLMAKDNHNTAPIAKLVNELPNSAKVRIIMQYIKAFTPVKFKQATGAGGLALTQSDGRALVTAKLRDKSTSSDWDVDSLLTINFFDWQKEAVEKEVEFDLASVIKRFVAKIDGAMKKGVEPVKADALRVQRNLAVTQLKALGVAL